VAVDAGVIPWGILRRQTEGDTSSSA
jgi:hypothetical protein